MSYFMFVAAGEDDSGLDNKVHLVEWFDTVTDDPEAAFQRALDAWSKSKPYMGDWTLVHALNIVSGRIRPVKPKDAPPPDISMDVRIFNAMKHRLLKED